MISIRSVVRDIQSWLLGPEVQLTDVPHRGGVVGWFDEKDSPIFLYPEVVGYYLTWLAFFERISGQVNEAAYRANLALSWIDRQLSDGAGIKTRIYLTEMPNDDWRNRGSFVFDLAMLIRGIASVRNLADYPERRALAMRLMDLLLPFCTESGSLHAFQPHEITNCFPSSHWSCVDGSYQTKVAASLLSVHAALPIPSRLRETAISVYHKWREPSQMHSAECAHATFYYMEGLIIAAANGLDPGAWSLAANAFIEATKATPGFYSSNPQARSDVIGQALRIGCILHNKCHQRDTSFNRIHHLAEVLMQFATDEGAILFSQFSPLRHKNVWASMFAHQALCFYECVAEGLPIDNGWLQFLV